MATDDPVDPHKKAGFTQLLLSIAKGGEFATLVRDKEYPKMTGECELVVKGTTKRRFRVVLEDITDHPQRD